MLAKTRGIVLHAMKYKETSVITRVYTERYGTQSYLVNGVRSKKSKKGLALLQPLSLLDMVVYYRKEKADGLQRLSEYKPAYSLRSIPFEVKKSSMALFLTEFFSKTLKEEESPSHTFEFLYQSIVALDQRTSQYENLHLYIMVQLTHHIGFGIHSFAELSNQSILSRSAMDHHKIYHAILQLNRHHLTDEICLSTQIRKDTLQYLVSYYQRHLEGFKDMKSLEILSQLFA